MRLISVETYEIYEFVGDSVPEYAIFSHTWEDEEVLFQHMQNIEAAMQRKGFRKIEFCCRQAKADGWRWIWVDTCCIDKTSSAELSEAINSMFQWYAKSMVCYVYLSDTTSPSESDLHECRWFFRGWTLQELLAPFEVLFFDASWNQIGDKFGLSNVIEDITGIHKLVLSHGLPITEVSVMTRMHWASKRNTSRAEDVAYSLMGIFDVNMPLLYGEGLKAFDRLQEKILRVTEDHTIFLWDCTSSHNLSIIANKKGLPARNDGNSAENGDSRPIEWRPINMLPRSPSAFRRNRTFRQVAANPFPDAQFINLDRGLRINLPILKVEERHLDLYPELKDLVGGYELGVFLAVLNCYIPDHEIIDDQLVLLKIYQQRHSIATFTGSQATLDTPRDMEDRVAIVLRRISRGPIRDSSMSRNFTRVGQWFYVIKSEEYLKWDFETCFISDKTPWDYGVRVFKPIVASDDLEYVVSSANTEFDTEGANTRDGIEHFRHVYALGSDNGPSFVLQVNLLRSITTTRVFCEVAETLEQLHPSSFHAYSFRERESVDTLYHRGPSRDGPVFKKRQILRNGVAVEIIVIRERKNDTDVFMPRLRLIAHQHHCAKSALWPIA